MQALAPAKCPHLGCGTGNARAGDAVASRRAGAWFERFAASPRSLQSGRENMSTPHRQPLPVVSCARGIGARLRRWVLSTLALPALLLGAHVAPARAEVALHAFNWPYATVEARAAEIAERGYRAVLVAPPLRSQ